MENSIVQKSADSQVIAASYRAVLSYRASSPMAPQWAWSWVERWWNRWWR